MSKTSLSFFELPDTEKAVYLKQISSHMNIKNPIILEKDFWVCWTLDRLFKSSFKDILLFKGGTSLSKIYAAIDRFSEDVDLGIIPSAIGWDDERLKDPKSRTGREKQMVRLQNSCRKYVKGTFFPALIEDFKTVLKLNSYSLHFSDGKQSDSSDIIFNYPSVLAPYPGYIEPSIKLELGSLSNQEPIETFPITLMLTHEEVNFTDITARVNTLSVKRTFWEKATILNKTNYRSMAGKKLPARYSRHFYDFFKLWERTDIRRAALHRRDILDDVVSFKMRFFADKHAQYEHANTGNLRLVPTEMLSEDLKKDYILMKDMFITEPPAFEEICSSLSKAEGIINTEVT